MQLTFAFPCILTSKNVPIAVGQVLTACGSRSMYFWPLTYNFLTSKLQKRNFCIYSFSIPLEFLVVDRPCLVLVRQCRKKKHLNFRFADSRTVDVQEGHLDGHGKCVQDIFYWTCTPEKSDIKTAIKVSVYMP